MNNLTALEISNFITSGKLHILKDIISQIEQVSDKDLEYAISNDSHNTYIEITFGSPCYAGEELSYFENSLYFEPVDFILQDIKLSSCYNIKLDISNISDTDRNTAVYKAIPDCYHEPDYDTYVKIWTEEDMNSIYDTILNRYKKLGYNFHINNSYFIHNGTRRFEII